MVRAVLNHDHLGEVLGEALGACRHRLFLATANVKDLHLPLPGTPRRRRSREAEGLLAVLARVAGRGVDVRLLHSAVPSGPLLHELRDGLPPGVTMRRCPRLHAKAVIADGRWMYLGSANLTGAGLGAKSPRRRNFEAGICTDRTDLIDPVLDMLDAVWQGTECPSCGRRDHCPAPLEEPDL